MVRRTRVRGQHVLVFGLGLFGGGASVVRWYARAGAQVRATDKRPASVLAPTRRALRSLPVQYVLGRHRAEDIRWSELIVKNPGVPDELPFLAQARRLGRTFETDTALFFQYCPAPLVAITGTKGKSTTATLTALFLRTMDRRVMVGGNLGIPLLDIVGRAEPDVPMVVELSSWQIEGLAAHRVSPHIGILTNVLPDHLNRYSSFAAYGRVKQSLVAHQQPGDVAILNADDPLVAETPVGKGVTRRFFSAHRRTDAWIGTDGLYLKQNGRAVRFARWSDIRVPGLHYRTAILAAALAATAAGANYKKFALALRSFKGLTGRLEVIRKTRGVTWINDTTATAPVATEAALRSLTKKPILIVGGVDKHLPYESLARAIRRRVKHVVLLPGTASDQLSRRLRGWSNVTSVIAMPQAVAAAAALARAGDTVLLSPAAASFNLFKNEFDRGNAFVRAVNAL